MKQVRTIITIAMLVCASVMLLAPTLLAEDIACDGTVGSVTVDNLIVADGKSCILSGTTVTGHIFVQNSAILVANDIQVVGNIQANGASSIVVTGDSRIGGNIQAKGGGSAEINGVVIDGDLQIEENVGMVIATDNKIGGNLQAFDNTGGLTISLNAIGGNLQCRENDPEPTVGDENSAESREGQCATDGEESDDNNIDEPGDTEEERSDTEDDTNESNDNGENDEGDTAGDDQDSEIGDDEANDNEDATDDDQDDDVDEEEDEDDVDDGDLDDDGYQDDGLCDDEDGDGDDDACEEMEVDVDVNSGGELTVDDDDITIRFMASSVAETTRFRWTETELDDEALAIAPGSYGQKTFMLKAIKGGEILTEFKFEEPIQITINYTDQDVMLIDEANLTLYYRDVGKNEWRPVSETCADEIDNLVMHNKENNQLTVTVCHLTQFGLFGQAIAGLYLPLVP